MPERRPRLEGKVAIVTGAGSSGAGIGNGKAAAVLFASEGARVVLVDLHEERGEETRAVIRGEGGEASVFRADVTIESDCRQMVAAALGTIGYFLKKYDWPRPPFVIGLILGPIAEDSYHKAMSLWGPAFLLRHGALIMIGLIVLSIGFYVYQQVTNRRKSIWLSEDDH